jgi:hypothetical protein
VVPSTEPDAANPACKVGTDTIICAATQILHSAAI